MSTDHSAEQVGTHTMMETSRSRPYSAAQDTRPSQFQQAANLGGPPENKRTRFSFDPPSLFDSVRRHRQTGSGKPSRPELNRQSDNIFERYISTSC